MRTGIPGAVLLLAVLATVPGGARATGIHARLRANPWFVEPGDTIVVEAEIFPGDAEFNAFALEMTFDPEFLTFVPTYPLSSQRGPLVTGACANTFHTFTAGSTLEASLSLLCNNVFVTGPGVFYRVRFAAGDHAGVTTVGCGPGTRFYRAGSFVDPVDCPSLTLVVGQPSGVPPVATPAPGLELGPPIPNPAAPGRVVRMAVSLAKPEEITAGLFDVAGRGVFFTNPVARAAGIHQVEVFPPAGIPSGLYFLQIGTSSGLSGTRRLLILR